MLTLKEFRKKESDRLKKLKWKLNNPQAYKLSQDKYNLKTRVNHPCSIPNCPNTTTQRWDTCDDHHLKSMTGSVKLYYSASEQAKRLSDSTNIVSRDIYFLSLLLVWARQEIRSNQPNKPKELQ